MNSNNQNQSQQRNYSGTSGGSTYSGVVSPDGRSTTMSTPGPDGRATQIQVRREFDYDWTQIFTNIPHTMVTKVHYTSTQDWVMDYVIYDMMSDYTPKAEKEGFFHWMFIRVFGIFGSAPVASSFEYNLSQEIRALLREQLIDMVAVVRERRPVSLIDYVDLETGDKKKSLLFVMNNVGDMLVRNLDNQERCTLSAGDVLSVDSGFAGSQSISVRVKYAMPEGDSCEAGAVVALDYETIQDSVNRMVQRIERAAQAVIEKRPGTI